MDSKVFVVFTVAIMVAITDAASPADEMTRLVKEEKNKSASAF